MAITTRTFSVKPENQGQRVNHRDLEITAEKVEYEGQVVATFTRDIRIMSDVWELVRFAVVAENGAYRTIDCQLCDKSWYCPPYDVISVEVDASTEDLVKYEEYLEECRRQDAANQAAAAQARYREQREQEFHTPARGKVMQVVQGRKVPKGTIGMVLGVYDGQYGPRALLALGEEKVNGRYTNTTYVPAGYLRNVDPEGPRY